MVVEDAKVVEVEEFDDDATAAMVFGSGGNVNSIYPRRETGMSD